MRLLQLFGCHREGAARRVPSGSHHPLVRIENRVVIHFSRDPRCTQPNPLTLLHSTSCTEKSVVCCICCLEIINSFCEISSIQTNTSNTHEYRESNSFYTHCLGKKVNNFKCYLLQYISDSRVRDISVYWHYTSQYDAASS